jgi:hypothetical protein
VNGIAVLLPRQECLDPGAAGGVKGEAIEVEATNIEPGEPTGEELPLDEKLRSLRACVILRGALYSGADLLRLLCPPGDQERRDPHSARRTKVS